MCFERAHGIKRIAGLRYVRLIDRQGERVFFCAAERRHDDFVRSPSRPIKIDSKIDRHFSRRHVRDGCDDNIRRGVEVKDEAV